MINIVHYEMTSSKQDSKHYLHWHHLESMKINNINNCIRIGPLQTLLRANEFSVVSILALT